MTIWNSATTTRSGSILTLLSALTLAGCSTTQTTTSVRSTVLPPAQHVRLLRPAASALSTSWRQEGHSIVGQLSFANACRTETTRVTQREQVSDTHPNKSYTTAAYITGAVFSMVGVGLIAASSGQDDTVTCGNGSAPRAGDSCNSAASATRTGGMILLGTGLGTVLGGILAHSRKPIVETTTLAPQKDVTIDDTPRACAATSALDGVVVSAQLSDGGAWSGRVDAQGAVRIELSANAALTGAQSASFSIESAPDTAVTNAFAARGTPLGDLRLSPVRASALLPAKSGTGASAAAKP